MTDAPTVTLRSGRDVAIWAGAAAVLMAVAILGGFFIAPEDAEGEIQRLLFLHVPIAITSLIAFLVACVAGIFSLRRRDERLDELVTISIGIGLLFVVLTIISGSIWARGFWGTWWRWDDPRLVTYLIIGLLYAGYFMLRNSAEESRQARFSAIYAIVAFASVPLSFWAVRSAQDAFHPTAVDSEGLHVDSGIFVWLMVAQAAVLVLFVALVKLELLQRGTERSLARLRMALEERV